MNDRPFESSDIFATRRLPAGGALMTKVCPFAYAATGHNMRKGQTDRYAKSLPGTAAHDARSA